MLPISSLATGSEEGRRVNEYSIDEHGLWGRYPRVLTAGQLDIKLEYCVV